LRGRGGCVAEHSDREGCRRPWVRGLCWGPPRRIAH
jgi:hypothetical protein